MRSLESGVLRARLREATRDAHCELDTLVDACRPFSSMEAYGAFLLAQQRARLRLHGRFGGLAPDPAWAARLDAHASALGADLREVGATPVAVPLAGMARDPSAGWGLVYVLEGSTLGGAVLRRRAAAALGPSVPLAFLGLGPGSSSDPGPGGGRSVRDLDRDLDRCAHPDAAVEAAVAAFTVFLGEFGGTFPKERADP